MCTEAVLWIHYRTQYYWEGCTLCSKDTCVAKLNSDFELIKGLNECDDAYRVIPQPTARPCEVDIQKQYKQQKKLSLNLVNGKETHIHRRKFEAIRYVYLHHLSRKSYILLLIF